MIEVYPNLFVGNQIDYEKRAKGGDWSVVQACKEPYHREALGYEGLGGPRDDPEYLFAYRQDGNCRRLILNMVDAPKPTFFAKAMMDEALKFIGAALGMGAKTLIHCNQGGSRSPSLAMLYLRNATDTFAGMDFEQAEDFFRLAYPCYAPGNGIREYVRQQWSRPPASQ